MSVLEKYGRLLYHKLEISSLLEVAIKLLDYGNKVRNKCSWRRKKRNEWRR